MANIKDLKKKIKSTKSTLKITSAMKLVSAAKLAKAQQAITAARPYAEELGGTIKTVSALVENYQHAFFNESENKQIVLLVISSDKGLCGNYNSALAKEIRIWLKKNEELDVKVFFIGKKVMDLLKKQVNVAKKYEFAGNDATYLEIQKVAEELSDMFESGEVGRVLVAFNKFNSAISFTPTVSQLLPMTSSTEEKEQLEKEFPFDFEYDPSPAEILDDLIPLTYATSIYTSVLDAAASEHGTRMSAMDNAVRNSKEMIDTLTLKANKLRQASITTELIEVVSGAESLNA